MGIVVSLYLIGRDGNGGILGVGIDRDHHEVDIDSVVVLLDHFPAHQGIPEIAVIEQGSVLSIELLGVDVVLDVIPVHLGTRIR